MTSLDLYIVCQTRYGDLDNFFMHENQAAPSYLFDGNMSYGGTKHDLVPWLESCILQEQRTTQVHEEDVWNYASTSLKSYISKHIKVCDRVDVVWDTCKAKR